MSSVAEKFITSLLDFHKNSKSLKEELSKLEKKISDIYHVLEYLPLNAAKTAMVTKELRSVLKQRREVKFALSLMSSVRDKGLGNLEKVKANNLSRNSKYYQESLESYKKLFGSVQ